MNAAYNNAMAALAIVQGMPVDSDDMGMATASDADLRTWADDLADRVGLNVDAFRVAIEAYITERKTGGMDAVLDAVAEHAMACYYREANVPENDRHDDDCHALLNGVYSRTSLVDLAESAGQSMPDTRAACAVWHTLSDDCNDCDGVEVAQVFAEAGDMVTDAGLRGTLADAAERERDTWHAIANRPDGDASDVEALQAWEDTLEGLQ